MRHYKLLLNLFLLLLISILLFSCNANQRNQKLIEANESMLRYVESSTSGLSIDSIVSDSYFRNLTSMYNRDSTVQVAYYTILGDASSKHYDLINKQSELYYQKAIQLAEQENLLAMKVWSLVNYGFYYYSFRKPDMALPLFMEATFLIDEIGEENILMPEDVFRKLGFFFGNMGNNEDAISYLNKANQYARKLTQQQQAMLLDNIGQYQLKSHDTSAALNSFLQAESLALGAKDSVRYGKVLGNLALIHLGRQNYKEALTLVNRDLYYSLEHNSDQNTMYARVLKAKILLEMDSVSAAAVILDSAKNYADAKIYLKTDVLEIQKLKLKIACLAGDEREELLIRRELNLLEEVVMGFDGELNLLQNKWRVDREKNKNSLILAESNMKTVRYKYFTFMAAVLVIVVGLFLFIANLRRKSSARALRYEKKVVDLQLKKIISDKNLLLANETLASYKEYLTEKNKQINDLQLEISTTKESSSLYLEQEKGLLQDLLDSHLLTEENWVSFRRAFDASYPNFYLNLKQDFPELTESNMRYLILSKLGLSIIEISNLLGISTDSVKKSRQRLKKKIGIRYKDFEQALYN